MKKLKYVFIVYFLIFVTSSVVARSATYQRFSDSTLTEKPETKPDVNYEVPLHFDSGSVIISENLLIGQGKYSANLMHFTPRYKITRLVVNSNNDVRLTFSVMDGKTVITVWLIICGIISFFLLNLSFYLFKKALVNNYDYAKRILIEVVLLLALSGVVAVIGEATVPEVVAVGAAKATGLLALAVVLAALAVVLAVGLAAIPESAEEAIKPNKFLIWVFNILMIIFIIVYCYQI
jgi:hypothetical protein